MTSVGNTGGGSTPPTDPAPESQSWRIFITQQNTREIDDPVLLRSWPWNHHPDQRIMTHFCWDHDTALTRWAAWDSERISDRSKCHHDRVPPWESNLPLIRLLPHLFPVPVQTASDVFIPTRGKSTQIYGQRGMESRKMKLDWKPRWPVATPLTAPKALAHVSTLLRYVIKGRLKCSPVSRAVLSVASLDTSLGKYLNNYWGAFCAAKREESSSSDVAKIKLFLKYGMCSAFQYGS